MLYPSCQTATLLQLEGLLHVYVPSNLPVWPMCKFAKSPNLPVWPMCKFAKSPNLPVWPMCEFAKPPNLPVWPMCKFAKPPNLPSGRLTNQFANCAGQSANFQKSILFSIHAVPIHYTTLIILLTAIRS